MEGIIYWWKYCSASRKNKSDKMIFNTNNCHLYVKHASSATFRSFSWTNKVEVLWSKYQIKESDFRSKTMTFTSPQ